MNPFRLWMLKATTAEKETLASTAGVSRVYIYQLADGIRDATSGTAGRIAAAAKAITRGSKGRLPEVTRMDLSSVCAGCEYAKNCRRER